MFQSKPAKRAKQDLKFEICGEEEKEARRVVLGRPPRIFLPTTDMKNLRDHFKKV